MIGLLKNAFIVHGLELPPLTFNRTETGYGALAFDWGRRINMGRRPAGATSSLKQKQWQKLLLLDGNSLSGLFLTMKAGLATLKRGCSSKPSFCLGALSFSTQVSCILVSICYRHEVIKEVKRGSSLHFCQYCVTSECLIFERNLYPGLEIGPFGWMQSSQASGCWLFVLSCVCEEREIEQ